MKQDNSRGYAALRSGAALVERPDVGRLLIRGNDRRSYLQGLLTNDIETLTAGSGCYAAMLTAQGRMITDMHVLELGDALLLQLPIDRTSAIKDHLERFVFSEDVTVEDVTQIRTQIGLYGPHSARVLSAAGIDAQVVSSDAIGIAGFDIFVDAPAAAAVRSALVAAGAVPATAEDVETVRIESGRPLFGVDMDGETIPLEAGLEDRAISRTKGCYVGQEVIVRVQDRGHGRVARRLVGLTFAADAAVPERGALVRSGDRDIGRITSAAWSPSLARPVALAYVQRDFIEPGTRVQAGGSDADVSPLPLIDAR